MFYKNLNIKKRIFMLLSLSFILIIIYASIHNTDNISLHNKFILKINNAKYYWNQPQDLIYKTKVNKDSKVIIARNVENVLYYKGYIYFLNRNNSYTYKIKFLSLKDKNPIEKFVYGEILYCINNYIVYRNTLNDNVCSYNIKNRGQKVLTSNDELKGFKDEWTYYIDKKGYLERKNIYNGKSETILCCDTLMTKVNKFGIYYIKNKNGSLYYLDEKTKKSICLGGKILEFTADKKWVYYISLREYPDAVSKVYIMKESKYGDKKPIYLTTIPDKFSDNGCYFQELYSDCGIYGDVKHRNLMDSNMIGIVPNYGESKLIDQSRNSKYLYFYTVEKVYNKNALIYHYTYNTFMYRVKKTGGQVELVDHTENDLFKG